MIIDLEEVKERKLLIEEIANRLEVARNMSSEELEELYREYYSN